MLQVFYWLAFIAALSGGAASQILWLAPLGQVLHFALAAFGAVFFGSITMRTAIDSTFQSAFFAGLSTFLAFLVFSDFSGKLGSWVNVLLLFSAEWLKAIVQRRLVDVARSF